MRFPLALNNRGWVRGEFLTHTPRCISVIKLARVWESFYNVAYVTAEQFIQQPEHFFWQFLSLSFLFINLQLSRIAHTLRSI